MLKQGVILVLDGIHHFLEIIVVESNLTNNFLWVIGGLEIFNSTMSCGSMELNSTHNVQSMIQGHRIKSMMSGEITV